MCSAANVYMFVYTLIEAKKNQKKNKKKTDSGTYLKKKKINK